MFAVDQLIMYYSVFLFICDGRDRRGIHRFVFNYENNHGKELNKSLAYNAFPPYI